MCRGPCGARALPAPPSPAPNAPVLHGRDIDPAAPRFARARIAPALPHRDEVTRALCRSVRVTFVLKDGSEREVEAKEGQSILDVAHSHEIELEGARALAAPRHHARPLPPGGRWRCRSGACEASIACSTCHVILEDEAFEALPEASEKEDDMLDMAFGLTPTCVPVLAAAPGGLARDVAHRQRLRRAAGRRATPAHSRCRSRLGCQVFITKDLEGMRITIPKASRNMYVDGHVPKPH